MFQTIHHKKFGPSSMYEIDARAALKAHPEEWSTEPWPEEAQTDAPAEKPVIPDGTFMAAEKGRGWWAIYDSNGAEQGKSIREADGRAFNELTVEDRAEYVKAHLAEG